MSERVHLLAQSILGKSSLEECNLQEIRELVQRYPYFAPAQFLYLQKLKSENAAEYSKQLQKAVLYYHNPLAFEYFISSDRFHSDIVFEEKDLQPLPGDKEPQPEKAGENQEEGPPEVEVTPTPEDPVGTFVDVPVITAPEEKEPPMETPDANEEPAVEEPVVKETTSAEEPGTQNQKQAADLAFEPYHTVDYFASQGIKLSQEEVSKDKFGRQLKSFTEWLKTMKRLPAKEVSQVDTASEKNVVHLAEDSVHNADVFTEAMAEVWLKQGNREKAIETYNKLSLLNPSKRAYFATLIENLKRS